MDTTLWTKILVFDLDKPYSRYGFSARLEKENYWTKDFTQKAILEYKKFMYLAATSEQMVSPSEIVDIVWHQHLTFTKSYEDFGRVLGKKIHHIPSTHNFNEVERFKQAKEHTNKLYKNAFGNQPVEIWNYSGMYESLELPKAKYKLRTFLIAGLLGFAVLILPFYFLLSPIYPFIEGGSFMLFYIIISVLAFILLRNFNKLYLTNLMKGFNEFSFIKHLQPSEILYLETQHIGESVHGEINRMVEVKKIGVGDDLKLYLNKDVEVENTVEFCTIEILQQTKKMYYSTLVSKLTNRVLFTNIEYSMAAFEKYFNKSIAFARLFYMNFGILSLLTMIGLTRLISGVLRDKPSNFLFFYLFILVIVICVFLSRMITQMSQKIVPTFYKKVILPEKNEIELNQWRYFLLGSSVFSEAFIPAFRYSQIEKGDASGGSSSGGAGGCGSSCGSSCGGGCGGCGS